MKCSLLGPILARANRAASSTGDFLELHQKAFGALLWPSARGTIRVHGRFGSGEGKTVLGAQEGRGVVGVKVRLLSICFSHCTVIPRVM